MTLQTSDDIQIAANYFFSGQNKLAILLHMMPATKESWDDFAIRLLDAGFASVAIDERGHGESTMGGVINYKEFSDTQQQSKQLDVEAAIEFGKKQGFAEEQIVVVGASIGANLAIQTLVQHINIVCAVALSPGLNYHGVNTEFLINKLHPNQKVLLVASDDDIESYESVQALHEMNPQQTEVWKQIGLGHGTRMIQNNPALIDQIIRYLVSF